MTVSPLTAHLCNLQFEELQSNDFWLFKKCVLLHADRHFQKDKRFFSPPTNQANQHQESFTTLRYLCSLILHLSQSTCLHLWLTCASRPSQGKESAETLETIEQYRR